MNEKILRKAGILLAAICLALIMIVPALADRSYADGEAATTITATTKWTPYHSQAAIAKGQFTGYTIKMPANGKLYVRARSYTIDPNTGSVSAGYVFTKLYNSKQSQISDNGTGLTLQNDPSSGGTYYVVKKGTYYLGFAPDADNRNVEFTIKYAKLTLPTNTKKSKALTLKRGKAYKTGYVPLGAVQTQWFKVKQTKTKKLWFYVNTKGIKDYGGTNTRGIKITAYVGKKKLGTKKVNYAMAGPIKITYSTKKGYAKKGTYYFKVETFNKYTGGSYKVKIGK
ncbi:MAG: hypothetical protein PUB39_01875 [Eubacteriales bacterium]|nr:hypothetical protein [Eubacteriales bacterium]